MLPAGAVMVIVMIFMAVTSSGASEMLAVSSLFTFDIYRRYINPKVTKPSPVFKMLVQLLLSSCSLWDTGSAVGCVSAKFETRLHVPDEHRHMI